MRTPQENIDLLVDYAMQHLTLDNLDEDYVRNALLDLLRLTSPTDVKAEFIDGSTDIQSVIDELVEYALTSGIVPSSDALLFETRLFGLVTPPPSQIVEVFNAVRDTEGIQAATHWYFEFSKANNYIRMQDINKNVMWEHDGKKGGLVVTINLSKPEKDPKQIQAALKAKTGYPKCLLCPSNVGFPGNAAHPARQTLRPIPIELGGEEWSLQYSPYQYYVEHAIAFCNEHRPMKVDKNCITRLVDFVDLFPHYFMGSNAALPIVGGSILTHDHYQGGGKGLPMFKAGIRNAYKSQYKGAEISVVEWYNSVVRVESKNKQTAIDVASDILAKWADYSDESVGILSKTDAQHNAVTPIARKEGKNFVVDMILRNNRTDETHPFGIFHPTEDMHNIKKEGIGIIEVMGTFILPGRLDSELKAIENVLASGKYDEKAVASESSPISKHAHLVKELVEKNGVNNSAEQAHTIVRGAVNEICERILECTAVFKNTEVGQTAFEKFMNSIGCVKK